MAKITTHVLDTARGRPASGVPVRLERVDGGADGAGGAGSPQPASSGVTDDDGRLKTLTDPDGVPVGTYRLTFDTGAYFTKIGQEAFFPEAQVTFVIRNATDHFHVPLLLAPFGFSTYRGS
jgi:5-hydroxyisourate hydrolase